MEQVDLVIKGGKVVSGGYTIDDGWISVSDGKVVAIGVGERWPEAKQIIDATGKYVLPGAVDPEQHPNRKLGMKRGLLSETRSALAGGITTSGFMAHSNTCSEHPVTLDENSTEEAIPNFMEVLPGVIDICKNNVMNDYFFVPIISAPKHAREIAELADKLGVTAFKFYLHCKGGSKVWDLWTPGPYHGSLEYDDDTIFRAMRNIAALGPPAILYIHCENYEIAHVFKEDLVAQGRKDPKAWADKSPTFVEAGHLRTYAYYAKMAGCPIINIHTTNPDVVEELKRVKADGTEVYGCTQPIYLTLDWDAGPTNVPLRSPEYFDLLWNAISDGTISLIQTDHYWVARSLEDVEKYGKKFPDGRWMEPGAYEFGFGPHAEFLLPTMLSEGVNRGRISIEKVVEVCCENTARRMGLYPKKGVIAPGSDADFAIVDLGRAETITRDMIVSALGWSYYEGWELTGWPVMIFLRGSLMMEWPDSGRREFVGNPIGKYTPAKQGHELYPIA